MKIKISFHRNQPLTVSGGYYAPISAGAGLRSASEMQMAINLEDLAEENVGSMDFLGEINFFTINFPTEAFQ